MKKVLSLILVAVLSLSLMSCGSGYISSYKAIGLVRSNTTHSCRLNFMSLEGSIVYKLRRTEGGSEGDIGYKASVEKGSVSVYYDYVGTKEKLFTLGEGQNAEGRGGYIESGKSVYIIIEAEKGSRGQISIDLNS